MKSNAPERIYVCDNVFPTHVDWDCSPINTKRVNDYDIEYVRKDAFIEKAEKWFKSHGSFTIGFDGATFGDFLNFINK